MHGNSELYPWLSAGLIAWGLLDCFLGYRVFKLVIALWGAALGAYFGHAAGVSLGLGPGGQTGGLVVGAVLGGGLAFLLYLAAVLLAGFLFGLTLGMLILANYNPNVALLAGVVLGVVGGIAAVKLQRILLILSTALLGACRAMLGLMYFTQHLGWFYYFQKPQNFPALLDGNAWFFPSVLALAVVGALAQFELKPAENGSRKRK